MTVHAQPAVLYDPSPAQSTGNINAKAVTVTKAGPGVPDSWPAPLTHQNFVGLKYGDLAFDMDDLDTVLGLNAPGPPEDNWCSVGQRPLGVPTADPLPASKLDLKAFTRGCDLGCGRAGRLRYLVFDGQHDPLYSCFFCGVKPMPYGQLQHHLDLCEVAKSNDWKRSPYQQERSLPAPRSTRCGHVLCQPCANVSAITSPPFGVCLICGLYCSVIKCHQSYTAEPTPNTRGYTVPEVFLSGNIIAHHRYDLFLSHYLSHTHLQGPLPRHSWPDLHRLHRQELRWGRHHRHASEPRPRRRVSGEPARGRAR